MYMKHVGSQLVPDAWSGHAECLFADLTSCPWHPMWVPGL